MSACLAAGRRWRQPRLRTLARRLAGPSATSLLVVVGSIAAVAAGVVPRAAGAQTIALTFEGGFDPRTQPRAATWNAALLKTLKDAKVSAMLFPAGRRVDSDEGMALVRDWGKQGHGIGNHTYALRDYGSPRVSFADMRRDVLAAQALLDGMPGWTRRLRFPHLNEGDTADKRDRMRDWLRLHDYRVASVTIDPQDTLYDQRWQHWRRQGDAARVERLKEVYLNHLWGQANQAEALARRHVGRGTPHVIRLETNGLNASVLPQAIRLFRRKGWKVVDADEAYRDALYRREVAHVPAGGSLLLAIARKPNARSAPSSPEERRQEERRQEQRRLGRLGL